MVNLKTIYHLNSIQPKYLIYLRVNQCMKFLSIQHVLKAYIYVALKWLVVVFVGPIDQKIFVRKFLDLMKAQKVKNSVIVPSGAKGGFILKKSIIMIDREETITRSNLLLSIVYPRIVGSYRQS